MSEVEKWKKRAVAEQQSHGLSLGDRTWDRFDRHHESKLRQKVAFAFIGPIQRSAYSEEQKKLLSEILMKCKAHSTEKNGDVIIAFLFICIYKEKSAEVTFPLIRVKKDDGRNLKSSYFIDHVGRVYPDWSDFLNKNIYDGCWICTPKDAEYSFSGQDIQVEFYDQSTRGRALRVADLTFSGVGIASSIAMVVGMVMEFFPLTAPIGTLILIGGAGLGAPSAAYGTGRSIETLVDRGTHEQSINPFSSHEARTCWLTTVTSVFSLATIGTGQVLASTAKAGLLAGSGTRFCCTALNATSVTINGLGVANSVYEVAKKKNNITFLDVLQLSTNIFFFTHSVVTFKTASSLIKDAQQRALTAQRTDLHPESWEVFDHMLESRREMVEPGKVRTMHGNKEFIRDLKKIKSPEEFFQHFQIVRGNQLSLNNELVINGKAFLQMTELERDILVTKSNDLKNNTITEAQFNKTIATIKKEYRLIFERECAVASQKIEEHLHLTGLQQHEIQRLDNVCSQAGKNYNPKCIEVGKTMATRIGCKDISESTAAAEYAIRHLDAEVSRLQKQNPNPPRPRGVKAKEFYFNQVAGDFLQGGEIQDNIVGEFQRLMRICEEQNSLGDIHFRDSMTAANHYDKHPLYLDIDPNNNNLSAESYFAIAREICSGPVENPKWVQNGSSLICKFYCEKYGAIAIRYDNLADGKSVIATLMSHDMRKTRSEPRFFSVN